MKILLFLLILVGIILLIPSVRTPILHWFNWTEIDVLVLPEGLVWITGSVNYIWGVDSKHQIHYCPQLCNGDWTRVHGPLLQQVDANDYEVWGVNHKNQLYKHPVDGPGDWKRIPGTYYYVSASGSGYIWTIHSDYRCAYKCKKPCNLPASWSIVDDHTCSLKQLDAGEKYLYAVNSTNHVLSHPVDGSGSWHMVPGRMTHVTVGPHKIYGIDTANKVYQCKKPCFEGEWKATWEEIVFDDDGGVKQIDATLNEIFAVSTGESIYQHKIQWQIQEMDGEVIATYIFLLFFSCLGICGCLLDQQHVRR